MIATVETTMVMMMITMMVMMMMKLIINTTINISPTSSAGVTKSVHVLSSYLMDLY